VTELSATETTTDLDETRVRQATIHHVNLKTTRLQEMIEWYKLVVGAEVIFEFPGVAFLSNDSANHRVALITHPTFVDDEDKIRRTGLHHVAFEYGSLDDLLATFLRLKSAGIAPGGCLDHGMTFSFYYFDPDGNAVELQVDTFGDWAASTRFMRSDPRFAADPIGTPFDPDTVVAARRAGATPTELFERAYAGEFPPTQGFDLRLPLEPTA
jgi:catechol 2,3-dioxygenase